MRYLYYGFIFPLIIIFDGCKESNPIESTQQTGVIIPLQIGNTWYKRYTIYDSLGNVVRTYVDSVRIYRDTTLDNEKWFIASKYSFTSGSIVFTNRTDGYYTRFEEKEPLIKLVTLTWKYPAMVSDSFLIPDTYVVVKSISDQITVEAGKFNCIQYRWNYNSWPSQADVGYEQAWLSPNVGEIKSLGYHRLPSGKLYLEYSSELISYKLNQ